MRNSFAAKPFALAVSCALVLGTLSGPLRAQTTPEHSGYLTEGNGSVTRSAYDLCWHAGSSTETNKECDPSAAPPPLAKAAEPQPGKAAMGPASEHLTLNADTLFDFDKAVLRPAGRVALDDFLDKMKGIDPEVITAVGHADRFGSDSYNQHLSEERAAAVKTYLLAKGIQAKRVQTEGKGETEPVTKAGDCEGAKSARVIACLQPDRRVDLEVVGTRILE